MQVAQPKQAKEDRAAMDISPALAGLAAVSPGVPDLFFKLAFLCTTAATTCGAPFISQLRSMIFGSRLITPTAC